MLQFGVCVCGRADYFLLFFSLIDVRSCYNHGWNWKRHSAARRFVYWNDSVMSPGSSAQLRPFNEACFLAFFPSIVRTRWRRWLVLSTTSSICNYRRKFACSPLHLVCVYIYLAFVPFHAIKLFFDREFLIKGEVFFVLQQQQQQRQQPTMIVNMRKLD